MTVDVTFSPPKREKGKKKCPKHIFPYTTLSPRQNGRRRREGGGGMSWRFPERSNSLWEKIRNFVEARRKSSPDFLTLNCFRQKREREKTHRFPYFSFEKTSPTLLGFFSFIFPRVRCQSHGKNLTSPLFPPPRS